MTRSRDRPPEPKRRGGGAPFHVGSYLRCTKSAVEPLLIETIRRVIQPCDVEQGACAFAEGKAHAEGSGAAFAASVAIGTSGCSSADRPWNVSRAITSLASFTTARKSGTAINFL